MRLGESGQVLLFVLVIVVTLTFVTTLPSLPTLFATPVSDSMEPTISQSDVVVINPTDSPEEGDVILFESAQTEQPVIHRIVGTHPDGFITQGDANERTDQETNFDHVTEDRISGTVVTVGGSVVSIPFIGVFLNNPFYLIILWLFVSCYSLISALFSTDYDDRAADRFTTRFPIIVVVVAIVVLIPAIIVGTPVVEEVSIVSSSMPPEGDSSVVAPGEQGEEVIVVRSFLQLGTHNTVHMDSDELTVSSIEQRDDGRLQLNVTNEPLDDTGVQRGTVSVYTYPAVLPGSLLNGLANIHPLLAAVASSMTLGFIFIISSWILVDPKNRFRESRKRIKEEINKKE